MYNYYKDNQQLYMEKYTILDKKNTITTDKNGNKRYKYLIQVKCNDCGKIRWINPSNTYYKRGVCRNCKEQEYRNQVLSIENENFKVIGIDIEGTKKNPRHTKYFVQCKKCGKIFSRRASVIRNSLSSIQCSNCRHIRYNKPLNVLEYKAYCYYRTGAKSRDLEWNLSEEQFKKLIKDNCVYCGNQATKRKTVSYRDECEEINGIDRIDSTKGYTIDNCVSCCSKCNLMKSNFTKEDFLNHISKIYKHSIRSSTTISRESTSEANADGNKELLTAV